DIYAAGEPPITGITLDALASVVRSSARGPVHVVPSLDLLPDAVATLSRAGDLVITLGAGSIGSVGERILEAIRHRRTQPTGHGERRSGSRLRPCGLSSAGGAACARVAGAR